MVRFKEVEDTLVECKRFEKKATDWLTATGKGDQGKYTSSTMLRASLDLSESLAKLRR